MAVTSLNEIEAVIRSAWSLDTCDPVDVDQWSAANPARGQCGVTALVLHDLLGGDLMVAPVTYDDGSAQGQHSWNRLAGGLEVDLTREQFFANEHVGEPRLIERPPGPPRRCANEYERLRARVHAALLPRSDRQVARTEGTSEG